MGSSTNNPVKVFERLLSCLLDYRRIPETNIDALKREYASYIQEVHDSPTTLQKFKVLDLSERVDCFLATHLKISEHRCCGTYSFVFLCYHMGKLEWSAISA